MRPLLALALLALLLPSTDASAAKTKLLPNNLLSIVTPKRGIPANAHPFVNAIVLFGRLSDGTPADPATFRARMGRTDITERFTPYLDDRGRQIGVRARLDAELVKLGRRPRNRLRLLVTAKRGKRRVRDKDRLRFSAIEGPNTPPVADGDADTDVIIPNIPITFTASKATVDADGDELTFAWDFGDGTSATTANAEHVYTEMGDDLTATLTVSDGQASATDSIPLLAIPPLDPGKTPGRLRVESDSALELGGVAIGATASKTLTFMNTDETETSQVKVRLKTADPAFQLSDGELSLGPGEARDVTVSFAPTVGGHQSTRVGSVFNASNRYSLALLAHGFGGVAPGTGPTLAADPVFYTDVIPSLLGLGTLAYLPDGRRVFVDNGVNTCVVPGNGLGTGDYCLTDQDCAANNGTCSTTSTCPSGARAGQPCSLPADCPGSFCPAYTLSDPVDLCSDGQSLFLISDEGTFTDPDPAAETERAVTVLRLDYDANGTVTNKKILYRTTTETGHIACDGFGAGQGGQVYVPEFHNVPDEGTCFRSEREALQRIAKANGNAQVVAGFGTIDLAEGLAPCDDLDPADQLEVTPDGSHTFAAFESGGLWQIRPSSIFFSPDITEFFQVHPDGSVLYADGGDSGTSGLVNLYRITASEVVHGPLPLTGLTACASFKIPNNAIPGVRPRTVVIGFAAGRTGVGSQDATALVSFIASTPGLANGNTALIPGTLVVRGTVAFSVPANTTTCSVAGLLNLEALELAF